MYLEFELVYTGRTMKNIVLIGLMGVGKSTVGKKLAQKIGRDFIDTDQLIEDKCGTSISVIFEVEGEIGFRKRENKVISEVMEKQGKIIATGGGAPMQKENHEFLKKGYVIYLFAKPISIWKRLQYDDSRPILQSTKNLKKRIEELFVSRDSIYRELADRIIIGESLPLKVVIKKIMNALKTEGLINKEL